VTDAGLKGEDLYIRSDPEGETLAVWPAVIGTLVNDLIVVSFVRGQGHRLSSVVNHKR
jgi:hypothetical protein